MKLNYAKSIPYVAGTYIILASSGAFYFAMQDESGQPSGQSTLLALGVYACLAFLALRRLAATAAVTVQTKLSALLIVVPAASVVWSVNPAASQVETGRLALTVFSGLVLVANLDRKQIFRLVLVALTLSLLGSFAWLIIKPSAALHTDGTFRGIYQHKNTLGFAASLTFILAIWRTVSFKDGRAFNAIALALSSIALIKSGSATSILVVFTSVATIFLARAIARTRADMRPLIAIVSFSILLIASAFIAMNVEMIASLVGRDLRFSGRAELWRGAIDLIRLKPITGYGYQVMAAGSTDLTTHFQKQYGDYATQFHNSWINIAFQLGAVGIVLQIVSYGLPLLTAIRFSVIGDRNDNIPIALALIVAFLTQSVSESTFLGPRSLQTFLLVIVMAVTSGLGKSGVTVATHTAKMKNQKLILRRH